MGDMGRGGGVDAPVEASLRSGGRPESWSGNGNALMVDGKPMIRLNDEPGFSGVDSPAEADLYRCVHCGLCLSACPTYTQLGVETESPRGRIALMKAVHEGRLGISERVVSHWEMCLQCRALRGGVSFGGALRPHHGIFAGAGVGPGQAGGAT